MLSFPVVQSRFYTGPPEKSTRSCFMGRKSVLAFFILLFIATSCLHSQEDTDTRRKAANAIDSQRFAEALQILTPFLKTHPTDVSAWTLQGLALNGLGKTKESLLSFDHALVIDKAYLPALEAASQTAYLHGDPSAMKYVKSLLATSPDNEIANAMAGALAYQSHDCKSANEYFEHSQKAVYQSPTAISEFADCQLKSEKKQEALATLSHGIQLHPHSGQLKYNLAIVQMQLHDFNGAIATLAPLSDAKDSELLNLLASAYAHANRPDDAFSMLEKAIQIDPAKESNYLDLAILCLDHSQENRAVTAASAGLVTIPRSASLYLIRGVAYAQLAQYDKAEHDFTAATELEPNQPHSTIAMSLLYSDKNDPQKEKELLEKQLRATPNDAVANYLLADLFIRSGAMPGQAEYDKAQNHLAKSLEAKPDSAEAQVLMGKLLEQQHDFSGALKHIQLALAIEPENRAALNREFILLRKLHRDQEANEALSRLRSLVNQEIQREVNIGQVRINSQSH